MTDQQKVIRQVNSGSVLRAVASALVTVKIRSSMTVFNWVRPVGDQRYSTTSGSELVNPPPVRYRSLYRTGVLVART